MLFRSNVFRSDFWFCLGGLLALFKAFSIMFPLWFLIIRPQLLQRRCVELGIALPERVVKPWHWFLCALLVAFPLAIRFGLDENSFFQWWDLSLPMVPLFWFSGALPKPIGAITLVVASIVDLAIVSAVVLYLNDKFTAFFDWVVFGFSDIPSQK